jgi:hypothetical protein
MHFSVKLLVPVNNVPGGNAKICGRCGMTVWGVTGGELAAMEFICRIDEGFFKSLC